MYLWLHYFPTVQSIASGQSGVSFTAYAPINVKPEGGGSGNPQEFDCGVYPQGGDFDIFLETVVYIEWNFSKKRGHI